MDSISDYLTIPQAAKKWRLSRQRVYKLIAEGRVETREIFGAMRIHRRHKRPETRKYTGK